MMKRRGVPQVEHSPFLSFVAVETVCADTIANSHKTVIQNKNPISWDSEPHYTALGETIIFYPVIQPPLYSLTPGLFFLHIFQ